MFQFRVTLLCLGNDAFCLPVDACPLSDIRVLAKHAVHGRTLM